jgi:hypothetical protein
MGQLYLRHGRGRGIDQGVPEGKIEQMSKLVSILAGGLLASMFSFDAQALPGSPVRVHVAASQVILVRNFCGPGFHRDLDDSCIPNRVRHDHPGIEAPLFGLPYMEPPRFGLPYVGLPVGLPYVGLPVGLPYVAAPVGLPYVGLPVGLPYVAAPVGLPYVAAPVGLPYIGPREFVSPRACPYGYYYSAHNCVPM